MTLTESLRALPTPAPPRDLTADVLSRVVELERQRQAATDYQTRPIASAWPVWAPAVIAAVIAAAFLGVTIARGGIPPMSLYGSGSIRALGDGSRTAVIPVLVAGLAFYVIALFLSLRPTRRTATR